MGKIEQGKGNQGCRVGLTEKVILEPCPLCGGVEGAALKTEGMARAKALG